MKQVQFKKLTISSDDILSRGEMKSVVGGYHCWCYNGEYPGIGEWIDCGYPDDAFLCCEGRYTGLRCES